MKYCNEQLWLLIIYTMLYLWKEIQYGIRSGSFFQFRMQRSGHAAVLESSQESVYQASHYQDEPLTPLISFSIQSILYQIRIDINFKTFEEHLWELERAQTDGQIDRQTEFINILQLCWNVLINSLIFLTIAKKVVKRLMHSVCLSVYLCKL